jgi:general secretion pathway protein L
MKGVNLAMSILAAVLLLACIVVPIWQRAQRISDLEGQIAGAKKEADAAANLRKQIENLTREVQFLAEQKKQNPVLVTVLQDLSKLLPDDTWLYQFELNGAEISIQGESTASSAIIGLIESAPSFKNAQFRSPVTQNRQTNAERFNISAEVTSEPAS